MITHRSPIDPIFYLHHTYYDFLWDQAQAGWKANRRTSNISFQYDFKRHCTPNTQIPAYNNTLKDVIDSNVNLGVYYALRGEIINMTVFESMNATTTVLRLKNSRRRRSSLPFSASKAPAWISIGHPTLENFTHCPPNLSSEYKEGLFGSNTSEFDWLEKHARTICDEALNLKTSGAPFPEIIRYPISTSKPIISDGSFGTSTWRLKIKRIT